jgi:hypothetical protein
MIGSKDKVLTSSGKNLSIARLDSESTALAPQGVPNADIVVTDIEGSRLCWIQVKTRQDLGSDGGWHMNAKHENLRSVSTPA